MNPDCGTVGSPEPNSPSVPSRKRQRTGESVEKEDVDKPSLLPENLPPVRDSDYYRQDGDCVFVVENTLFKIHKYILSRDDSAFADMFSLPVVNDSDRVMDGSSDESAIRLFDSPEQFRALLKVLLMMPHEAEAMTASVDNVKDLLYVSEIANKYHFSSTTSWAVNSVYKLVTKPELPFAHRPQCNFLGAASSISLQIPQPTASTAHGLLQQQSAMFKPMQQQQLIQLARQQQRQQQQQLRFAQQQLLQQQLPQQQLPQQLHHMNGFHQPFGGTFVQPGPAGGNNPPYLQAVPQPTQTPISVETCYLDKCPDDVLAHILDVAVLCSHEDLRNQTVKTWTARLKVEKGLDLHVALDVAIKHGLRVLQGAIYYSKLLSMDSVPSLGSGATPFVDDHMCEHHIERLLQGSWSLSKYWAQLKNSPPLLTPMYFCPVDKHTATCQLVWIAVWADAWEEASKTKTSSDVNAALNVMKQSILRELGGPRLQLSCRDNALNLVDRMIEVFDENLADHFLCT